VDTDVFQFFLDEMAKAVPKKQRVRQLLILDNASWHKAARLHWHHFEPKVLPGNSPDLNPINGSGCASKPIGFGTSLPEPLKS
jgi:hypothetical protein